MARKPRIHYPGAFYHVMLRGNGGQDICKDDADRTRFLLLLQENVERFSCRVHAFCLMSNHIHLAIQVSDVSLSRIMQNVCFRYTRYFNRKQGVTGHLFQGRFKALLLDADNYLLELVRYIHLNPVRAEMVSQPKDHPWSSHKTYCGEEILPWVTTDWILAHFSDQSVEAIKRYMLFVADGLADGYRVEFHKGTLEGRLLGNDDFVKTAFRHANQSFKQRMSMDDIIQNVCTCYTISPANLALPGKQRNFAEARTMAAWLIREDGDLSLTEFGQRTDRDVSSLSHAVTRMLNRAARDKGLADRMKQVKLAAKYQ